MSARIRNLAGACAALATAAFIWLALSKASPPEPLPSRIRCVLDVRRHNDTTDFFVCGYNYELLRRCGADLGIEVEIGASRKGESSLDSLRAGAYDLVVQGWPENTVPDSLLVSGHIDSLAVWIVRSDSARLLSEMETWVDEYLESAVYPTLHSRYRATFNDPFTAASYGRRRDHLSPYDSIIRVHSSEIGWDWRLLSALIYQESRFRIDLQSPKGAEGLMQMTPSTADRYELDNLLDPEINIATGVRHIARLQRLLRRRVNSPRELEKVVMAAYNAGEGHIRDCFYYADWKGVNDSTWAGLCAVMPALADSTILQVDTVKCGLFHVDETISYVERIGELYDAFCTICP